MFPKIFSNKDHINVNSSKVVVLNYDRLKKMTEHINCQKKSKNQIK